VTDTPTLVMLMAIPYVKDGMVTVANIEYTWESDRWFGRKLDSDMLGSDD
jgi:hypothetical protein